MRWSTDHVESVLARTNSSDREMVRVMLGRRPSGTYRVVVRRPTGEPVVIENLPFLEGGTPMPTLYWLLDPDLKVEVARMESRGWVDEAEAAVDPEELARSHRLYADKREGLIPHDHLGPRPYGGVGGTRKGVKCLHAHLAWSLAGGADPVGSWVIDRLVDVDPDWVLLKELRVVSDGAWL